MEEEGEVAVEQRDVANYCCTHCQTIYIVRMFYPKYKQAEVQIVKRLEQNFYNGVIVL